MEFTCEGLQNEAQAQYANPYSEFNPVQELSYDMDHIRQWVVMVLY